MSSIKESSLGLNYGWSYGETGWNSGMDENIVLTGFHANKQIKGILSTPPTTGVSNGDAYIVGSSPTGTWVGNYPKVAIYDRGSWLFATPSTGVSVYNKANGCWYEYNNEWSLKSEAEESPYIKVKDFDFSTGYTIIDSRQLLFYPTNQTYYQWSGVFPKVVPAGSTPETSGGIGAGAWIDRTDATLRDEIRETVFQNMKRSYAEAGLNLVDVSFELGGKTTGLNDVLLCEADGKAYGWHLDETKTVPAGSSPTNIGTEWIDKSGSLVIADKVNTNYGGTVQDNLDRAYPHQAKGYDVFYIYGQSNAVGYASNGAGYPTVTDRAKYWNKNTSGLSNVVAAMVHPSETSSGHAWGAFANEYVKITNRNIIFVPCAQGGTALADLSKGSTAYTNMTSAISNFESYATANSLEINSRSILFHQGETDMLNLVDRNTYQMLLDILIKNMRTDFGADKFFMFRCGCPQNRSEESWYGIQAAQDYLAQSYDYVVMAYTGCGAFTLGNGLLREGVHYTQKGYNVMGSRGAVSVSEALLKSSPESDFETRMYGGLLTTPDQIWRYTYGRAVYSSTSKTFTLIDINNTSYLYRTCNIKSIENLTDRLRFHIQSRAGYWLGFRSSINALAESYGFRATTAVTVTGTNTYAVDVFFYKDLEFQLSMASGGIAGYDSSAVSNLVSDLVTVTSLGTGYYKVSHPLAIGMPIVTPFYSSATTEADAKPIFITEVLGGSFKVRTFSTIPGVRALVTIPNVPIPIASLIDNIHVDIQAIVAEVKR